MVISITVTIQCYFIDSVELLFIIMSMWFPQTTYCIRQKIFSIFYFERIREFVVSVELRIHFTLFLSAFSIVIDVIVVACQAVKSIVCCYCHILSYCAMCYKASFLYHSFGSLASFFVEISSESILASE